VDGEVCYTITSTRRCELSMGFCPHHTKIVCESPCTCRAQLFMCCAPLPRRVDRHRDPCSVTDINLLPELRLKPNPWPLAAQIAFAFGFLVSPRAYIFKDICGCTVISAPKPMPLIMLIIEILLRLDCKACTWWAVSCPPRGIHSEIRKRL
jgi:hypothetical protein